MQTHSRYAFGTSVPWDQNETIKRVTAALKDEGLGVLTTIDVQAILKEKIDVDREPYVILGACAPQLANKALDVEPEIGVLLPCNVVVHQISGTTHVTFMDAEAALSLTGNSEIEELAAEVKSRLQRVLTSLSS